MQTPEIRNFKKLLVANRGEIAIRVLRAASELNITTVAIYTYEDRYSLHRYKADEAYQIGKIDEPLKPYLDIEEIILLAKEKEVDAIHPGYGFLSENVKFAQRCKEEKINFIGPSPKVMDHLGDKMKAKILARKIGIPLIEDSQNRLVSGEIALEEAKRIGFPVIIKAAAGGGGRGMRVVHHSENLIREFNEAKREAINAFGDDTVFIEKFIEDPKHLEIQILGDHYGNIVHLFERDCSVQRRFQKVVEVAPSKGLKEETLNKLYSYALRIANEVGYQNAGTVEFIIDHSENIYFIEVNPRIQVEHTVTEAITGIDIVRAQLCISMGYPLSDSKIFIQGQEDVRKIGYAIQCRITTEDPQNNFQPDFGTILAYRSASGMGIRLDAGSAFSGAVISPFYDSMLVKVTATGRTLEGASQRLHRALREFRIRGVKTNIGFLLNLLSNEDFKNGAATINLIKNNPSLFNPPNWKDRGTKLLKYLGEIILNGHPDIDMVPNRKRFTIPAIPKVEDNTEMPAGFRHDLKSLGREQFIEELKTCKNIQYTDTTFRDAHQSLLATRMRSIDMLNVANQFARRHATDVFSMEVWGGATFDVCLRFLREDPWQRLSKFRQEMPNMLLQMLLRGSNAVGYTAYPDNLVVKFIEKAAETGIDIFRIFDSLNWVENMKTSIQTVINETDSLAEACICYTGDVSDPSRKKYNLQYYIDLAKELEDHGAHIICIKDMAGLLKPKAAEILISALKDVIDLPIHLHTHDTSSIQSSTYLSAVNAGVDILDVAISSMSGLTSQPNFNSIAAMLIDHERRNEVDIESLNEFSSYWESVRRYYQPFETELKAGTAEVYDHEIPGGQYSNLRPQARGLGLEDKFETIKKNYKAANILLGDLIKVTPSSKVVGDLAMFMTSNDLTSEDILNEGKKISFPDSVKALMRGDLGQIKGGFPQRIQEIVLKGESAYKERPNAHLSPIDFEFELKKFRKQFGENKEIRDLLSYLLYDKVYVDFHDFIESYGEMINLPTPAYFYALKPQEEITVTIQEGKNVIIEYLSMNEPDEEGYRMILFKINGQNRSVRVRDNQLNIVSKKNRKADYTAENEIGSPLQGKLSKVLIIEGEEINADTPLFIIEAMKMESTISSNSAGRIKKIHLSEGSLLEQDDLVVELELY
jgi:pyruvate carboxylase